MKNSNAGICAPRRRMKLRCWDMHINIILRPYLVPNISHYFSLSFLQGQPGRDVWRCRWSRGLTVHSHTRTYGQFHHQRLGQNGSGLSHDDHAHCVQSWRHSVSLSKEQVCWKGFCHRGLLLFVQTLINTGYISSDRKKNTVNFKMDVACYFYKETNVTTKSLQNFEGMTAKHGSQQTSRIHGNLHSVGPAFCSFSMS